MATVNNKNDFQVISFELPGDWQAWLDQKHTASKGVWLRFYKKASGITSITYNEALEEALCYGWIDGQLKKYDDISYLQKFTPRHPKSIWSKRNTDLVIRLEKEGRMKLQGLKEAEAARAGGRWEKAYDSPGMMQIPDDFMEELSKNKKAVAFFNTLNKANLYAIAWRLQTAKKPETREKRMQSIIKMLANEEKFHD
jgi:uncharacterized protein YdeI (YjbR/CyaY-like superfamily)